MGNSFLPLHRSENIVVQNLDNETLIYDLTSNTAFCLNETSALIWQMCDGKHSVFDIAENLSKRFRSTVNEDFVRLALDELKDKNLLQNAEEFSNDFGGLSRREVIRKVGLATMVTLPVVVALVAPKSADAASNRALGALCTDSAGCASGCCKPAAAIVATCVVAGTVPDGTACSIDCECASGCCDRFIACRTAGVVATGGACRVNCQCISNSCNFPTQTCN